MDIQSLFDNLAVLVWYGVWIFFFLWFGFFEGTAPRDDERDSS